MKTTLKTLVNGIPGRAVKTAAVWFTVGFAATLTAGAVVAVAARR